MCWAEHMYDAMVHVYNNGLLDYTTPLVVSYTPPHLTTPTMRLFPSVGTVVTITVSYQENKVTTRLIIGGVIL